MVIELHGIKYYTISDISKRLSAPVEFVKKKIESEDLEACLIGDEVYVAEDTLLDFFTNRSADD